MQQFASRVENLCVAVVRSELIKKPSRNHRPHRGKDIEFLVTTLPCVSSKDILTLSKVIPVIVVSQRRKAASRNHSCLVGNYDLCRLRKLCNQQQLSRLRQCMKIARLKLDRWCECKTFDSYRVSHNTGQFSMLHSRFGARDNPINEVSSEECEAGKKVLPY